MRQQNLDKAGFPKTQTKMETLTALWTIMQGLCLLLPLHHLLLLFQLLIKDGGTHRLLLNSESCHSG